MTTPMMGVHHVIPQHGEAINVANNLTFCYRGKAEQFFDLTLSRIHNHHS